MTDAVLPDVTELTRFFWESGRNGRLLIQRCTACGFFSHPPYPRCPCCASSLVAPAPVSGRGTVYSYTVKPAPNSESASTVIAVVELDEQPGLRVVSNVTDCDREEVRIDLPVEVHFVERDAIWLPLFRPAQP